MTTGCTHLAGVPGIVDDYANMARAALILREVTGEERFLEQAKAWTKALDDHFWNSQINGYAFYPDDSEPLFVRPRMVFDNPSPAGNGTMLFVLTRLALLTGNVDYMSRASTLAITFGNEANRMLNGAGSYLNGFEYLVNALVVVVIGHKGNMPHPGIAARLLVQAHAQRHGDADRAGRSPAARPSRRRPRHGGRPAHRLHLPAGQLLHRPSPIRRIWP